MTQNLILQWDRDVVRVLSGRANANRMAISSAQTWAWPAELTTAAQKGNWLKTQLTAADIKTDSVRIVLPRGIVTMRNMHLPDVPDDELHEIVRFQAATRMSTPVDQLVLDYLPLPIQGEQESRNVIVVTLANKSMHEIKSVMESADIEIESIGLSAISIAELWRYFSKQYEPVQTAEAVSLIVLDDDPDMEFTVVWRGHVIFSHSIKVDATAREKSITAELNRSWIALQDVDATLAINHACVIGNAGQIESVIEILEKRLGTSVSHTDLQQESRLQSYAELSKSGLVAYGRLMGLLIAEPQSQIKQIDFCHPRQPVQKRDYDQYRVPAAIAAVVICLIGMYGFWQWRLIDLDDQIQEYQTQNSKLETDLKNNQPLYENYQQLLAWQQSSADYLQQWQQLNALAPESDRVYLTGIDFQAGNREIQMGLQARGHAKSRDDVEQVSDKLSTSGYRVQPREIRLTNLDAKYPFQFELDIELPILQQTTNDTK